jgi:Pyridoxamine 5'-phosphate oxidase
MARFFDKLTPEIREFIGRQHIFFVATAADKGRINLSPKGMDTFRVLADNCVAYLDLTGSGNETAGHIHHDGRLTIMLCSFDANPLILRLYGRGETIRPRDARWGELISQYNEMPGQRQIIVLHIESLQTSCGFGVPRYELVEDRQTLANFNKKKGPEGIRKYWVDKNQKTIDGLDTHLIEG